MYERLLSPVRLGEIPLRNRVVMAPMTRNRARRDEVPGEMAATYYGQRASAGLIITEATQVGPGAQGYILTPGIYTDAMVEGWRPVTEAVHARGGRIVVQLWHTGRISHSSVRGGRWPVAPSPVAAAGQILTYDGMRPFETPRALEADEIAAIVRDFGAAARNAMRAGFDGVEIHGANGYLVDQFLRDGSNQRTDAYGGPAEGRARFLVEVATAAAEAIGAGRVGVRLSPGNGYNSMSDSDPLTTFTTATRLLAPLGLAYLHVTEMAGQRDAGAAPEITRAIRAAWPGALMLNGEYTAERAEEVVASDEAQAVSFARPYVANPDLVERFRDGAPLAEGDRATYYGGDARGYIDYPTRT
ncbi:MAG TPA: alkene reductase, partial [Gemmatimonadales bacterium]|nr:alkene reductase [Gemmatimonadales bacterium]